ncbi:MAG: hypothetical protein ABI646_06180 [Acidobacteriota bacterium]
MSIPGQLSAQVYLRIMFYRPHFCCHCGEKIIRAKWTALTSRRFCEFCAIEQKQHDLMPRAAAVAILLFGAAGFTAYIGGSSGNSSSDRTASAKVHPLKTEPTRNDSNINPGNLTHALPVPSVAANSEVPSASAAQANTKQRGALRNSSTEPVYYCGAMTKKGTACTRRVKAPGRCWQHLGQPAASSLQN